MSFRLRSRAFPLAAAVLLIGLLPATAQAQESQPGNPGKGSERCTAAGSPNAPQYPPAQGEGAGISDSSPQRGQSVTASSGCREFAPGQQVAFGAESVFQQLGSVLATVGGEAVASFTVPTNLPDGQHHVVFRGAGLTGAPSEVRIPFVVAGGPATGAAAAPVEAPGTDDDTVVVAGVSLPRTGSNELVPLGALGLGLVSAGAGMVVVARRRRNGTRSALA